MAKQLYETLGVSKDAPPEDIRKAYRKAALRTHPDRLPPGASDKDKKRAEEQFRKVNNAYEVLQDEEKRRIYDRYGEFPPPEVEQDPYAEQAHHRHRHHPHAHHHRHGFGGSFNDPFFNDPFFARPFGSRSRPRNDPFFGFTDPFALFDQIFGDMRHSFEDPSFGVPFPSAGSPFARTPFGHSSLFDRMMGGNPAFGMLPPSTDPFNQSGRPLHGHSMSFSSSSRGTLTRGADGNPQWVSQSKMTRTVNGVTESVLKRTDSNGNEHVTYSYPDGQERYLINGVEQPSGSYVERNLPPPPPYSGPPAPLNTSRHSSDRGSMRQDMKYSPTTPTSPTGPYSAG
ncbi:DnaJ-domain-containing protein [Fomitiporia mediterranea MF3/22]|uniref:DnaJ-domain-containing protein n=1 Tax=Fomitiporia mediterranea (strain MF3/22) TaxID=694068 RepID=UPI000440912C|nr:DnaJ-domain-containing protein [Fomitiporia mediterranea MF3/22]EJD07636.1 DnaJ-domain-containing protein [Fomitiporia mediterranea MF3/22]